MPKSDSRCIACGHPKNFHTDHFVCRQCGCGVYAPKIPRTPKAKVEEAPVTTPPPSGVERVVAAWNDAGPWQRRQDKDRLRCEWPPLYFALHQLVNEYVDAMPKGLFTDDAKVSLKSLAQSSLPWNVGTLVVPSGSHRNDLIVGDDLSDFPPFQLPVIPFFTEQAPRYLPPRRPVAPTTPQLRKNFWAIFTESKSEETCDSVTCESPLWVNQVGGWKQVHCMKPLAHWGMYHWSRDLGVWSDYDARKGQLEKDDRMGEGR